MRPPGQQVLLLLLALMVGGLGTYLILDQGTGSLSSSTAVQSAPVRTADCSYIITRVDGYRHIHPLLSSEPVCPSPHYENLQRAIGLLADSLRATQTVNQVSVYVRDFVRGEWSSYNGDERYDPGSMLKVPLLLCYLSMSEEDPSILKRTYRCEQVDYRVPQFTAFPDRQAIPEAVYTVEQLLELSVVYSDNRATAMLLRHLTPSRYLNLFKVLGLPPPDWNAKKYPMTVRDLSVFMKAAYNSSVLSPLNSDKAMDLLLRSTFDKGLRSGIPLDVELAHKFGEAGDPNERQLHETGVVFMNGRPYLVTVMTRGRQAEQLAKAIALLAGRIHGEMANL